MKRALSVVLCILVLCAVSVTAVAGGPTVSNVSLQCGQNYQNIDVMYLTGANSVEFAAQSVPGCTASYSDGVVYLNGTCYQPGTYTLEMEVKRAGSFEQAECNIYMAPADPMVNEISGGGTYTVGEECTLWADFFSGGESCEIIWYSTTVNDISTIKAVYSGYNSYTVPQTVGTVYYCVAVMDHWSNGESSNIIYSPLTSVTYKESPATAAPVTDAPATAVPKTETPAPATPTPTAVPSPSPSASPSPSPNRRTGNAGEKHAVESPSPSMSPSPKGGKGTISTHSPSPSPSTVVPPSVEVSAERSLSPVIFICGGVLVLIAAITAVVVILEKKKK